MYNRYKSPVTYDPIDGIRHSRSRRMSPFLQGIIWGIVINTVFIQLCYGVLFLIAAGG
jgi:hypothetical protein